MNSSSAGGVEVTLPPGHRITRFYTLARRFPTLIGRLPNGSDIPYGPYTVGQFVTGVCLLVVGYRTMPLWGGGRGLFVNGPLLLGLTATVIIVMRKVPWRGRGPVPVLRGMLGSYSATEGTYRGKPLPARQAAPVVSAIVIADDAAMIAAEALLQQRHPAPVSPTFTLEAAPVSDSSTTRPRAAQRSDRLGIAQTRAQAGTQAVAQAVAQASAATGQDVMAAPNEVRGRLTRPLTGPLTGVQRLRQQAQAAAAATDAIAGSQTRPLTAAGSTGRH